eukprot:2405562-Karenia_brevis.AAC.1
MDLRGTPPAHHVNVEVMRSLSTGTYGNQQHDHMSFDPTVITFFQEHLCPFFGPLPQSKADDDIATSCTVGPPSLIRDRGAPYCRP